MQTRSINFVGIAKSVATAVAVATIAAGLVAVPGAAATPGISPDHRSPNALTSTPGVTLATAGASQATTSRRRGKALRVTRIRTVGASQRRLLRHGLRVRLRVKVRGHLGKRGKRIRLRAFSATFDQPRYRRLVRPKVIRVKRSGVRPVRLRLTRKGRRAAASCQRRSIRVNAPGQRARVNMPRNLNRCRLEPVDGSSARECDFITERSNSLCMFPFPSDFYAKRDRDQETGKRIDIPATAMPANLAGQRINPRPYAASDGFSPGAVITLRVPGLDNPAALARTRPVGLNNLARYSSRNQPIIVIDAKTRERHPIWVELDSHAPTPGHTALQIIPARNFEPGHRYIVAMRRLKDAGGQVLQAPNGFRYLRDAIASRQPVVNRRRAHFEDIFRRLRRADIRRESLYLAWDFTVASDHNNQGRLLSIRNQAFAELGDTNLADMTVQGSAPPFTVTEVDSAPADAELARRVKGTLTVPCFLTRNCAPGGTFEFTGAHTPKKAGTYTANFECIVPKAAVSDPDATPGRASLYGHGLLGRAAEVGSTPQRQLAQAHNFVTCASDEIGMSNGDVGNTIGILQDLGRFPELADRSQQGLLNQLLLGRLMIHPQGLISDPAFRVDPMDPLSPPVIDTSRLYYNGNSQGGIFGGVLTAVAPDFNRASLGVPGMNYSVLLPRSVDFDQFMPIMNDSYTDPLMRPLIFSLIQMLWDRSDPNGYAHRLTDNPPPNTPPHQVVLNVAFGDHQVTQYAADNMARTIGARAHWPALHPGRSPEMEPLWDVPRLTANDFPYAGSAIHYWDSGPVRPDPANPGDPNAVVGNGPPPLVNLPNRSGRDPHGDPRITPAEQQLVSEFLRPDGKVTNVCGAGPCFSVGFAGP